MLTRWHIFCTPDLLSLFPYFLILTFQSALLIFLLVKSSAFDRKLPFSLVSALGWFADLSALQLCSAWFVAMLFCYLLLGAQHSRYSRSRRAGTISIWWEVPFQRSFYLPVGRLKYFYIFFNFNEICFWLFLSYLAAILEIFTPAFASLHW